MRNNLKIFFLLLQSILFTALLIERIRTTNYNKYQVYDIYYLFLKTTVYVFHFLARMISVLSSNTNLTTVRRLEIKREN